ncbi:MAG: hypothetical protein ABWY27_03025 [Telluria sp.]
MQDFTKVGIQPEQAETPDSLTEAIRAGLPPGSARSGWEIGVKKLTGEIPMGMDAPTKGLRKFTAGASELLVVLRCGFGTLAFLLSGGFCSYTGLSKGFDFKWLAFAMGSLVMAGLFARGTLHAVRNLRSILKA